jgi:hypothetical protein
MSGILGIQISRGIKPIHSVDVVHLYFFCAFVEDGAHVLSMLAMPSKLVCLREQK